MPSNKVFEATDLNSVVMGFITGTVPQVKHMNMYEVAEMYYANVVEFMQLLDQGKRISYEHTKSLTLYRWQRKDVNLFVLHVVSEKTKEEFELTANDALNMIFKHAPFIEVIGTENYTDTGGGKD